MHSLNNNAVMDDFVNNANTEVRIAECSVEALVTQLTEDAGYLTVSVPLCGA